MVRNIYVDGSGGAKSGYGFFVKETGESFFEENLESQIIKQSILQ
jgi:ribonuclease HI